METISDMLNILELVFPMAFRKWEKVEGNIATQTISKDYLSLGTEISSHLFPLISSHEAAKVYRLTSLSSVKEQNKQKCEKSSRYF